MRAPRLAFTGSNLRRAIRVSAIADTAIGVMMQEEADAALARLGDDATGMGAPPESVRVL